MKYSAMKTLLESKGWNKPTLQFFGGGVQVHLSESSVSFKSQNKSALRLIQKAINDGGVMTDSVLSYQLQEDKDGDEDDEGEGDLTEGLNTSTQIDEGTSFGKLKQSEFDIIEANKDRKAGQHGVGKDGKEYKDITILSASATDLLFAQTNGQNINICEYNKSKNSAIEVTISKAQLALIK